jgi:hypothetical protein
MDSYRIMGIIHAMADNLAPVLVIKAKRQLEERLPAITAERTMLQITVDLTAVRR